ncbi:MAG: metallophosphoesterase [Bdellovibrionota bacterium]
MKKLKIGLFVFIVVGAVWSLFIEPSLLVQNNQKFAWYGPQLRIAFFSDLHAGAPYITKEYIKKLIVRINEQKPDIILVGGDLVMNGVIGGEIMSIEELAPLLKELTAPMGIFITLGNHDWWSNGDNIRTVLEKHEIQVLENQAVLLNHKKSRFWLIGIGDDFTNHADPTKAFATVNSEDAKIVFMHDPAALFKVKNNYQLAIAGHMHGGQVFIPGIGALVTPGAAPNSWAKGWIDFPMGKLFVSRGIGTSIFPVRFNAVPEYVILELDSR